jgi:(p)ppGpp synthase/HD superfamily hydrolase
MKFTPRIMKAINTAAFAHRKQKRKGGGIPYIIHPFAVFYIASEVTDDEDTLIACLFHDILEDVPDEFTRLEMTEQFGSRVVDIVEGVTMDDMILDWQKRSEAYLEKLERHAPVESVIVSCADKIHNLMSTLQDLKTEGEDVWKRFGAGADKQLWWYESVLGICQRRIPDHALTRELDTLVEKLRELVQKTA